MAQPDSERARAYRQRRAEQRAKLIERGAVEVKTVVAGPAREAIERVAKTTLDIYLDEPSEVSDDDVTAMRHDLRASYLMSGTPQMVEYRIEGVGSMGVKMIPFRSTPVLVTFLISGNDQTGDRGKTFREQFPIIDRIHKFTDYHWKTPEYLEICKILGIDAHYHEPIFHQDYSKMGWDLLEWDISNTDKKNNIEFHTVRNFVFDMLDLLRVDEHRGNIAPPELARELKRERELLDTFAVPHVDRILHACEQPECLGIRNANSIVATGIQFLPSSYGYGYLASIYGWYGNHEPDGWIKGQYDRVKGVAVLPSAEELEANPWTATVVRRLRENGVLFLTKEQAAVYEMGEGEYWRWRSCRALDVGVTKYVLWNLKPPATPINDRAVELARAADLIRQNRE